MSKCVKMKYWIINCITAADANPLKVTQNNFAPKNEPNILTDCVGNKAYSPP